VGFGLVEPYDDRVLLRDQDFAKAGPYHFSYDSKASFAKCKSCGEMNSPYADYDATQGQEMAQISASLFAHAYAVIGEYAVYAVIGEAVFAFLVESWETGDGKLPYCHTASLTLPSLAFACLRLPSHPTSPPTHQTTSPSPHTVSTLSYLSYL
jgi:hypothetical protein